MTFFYYKKTCVCEGIYQHNITYVSFWLKKLHRVRTWKYLEIIITKKQVNMHLDCCLLLVAFWGVKKCYSLANSCVAIYSPKARLNGSCYSFHIAKNDSFFGEQGIFFREIPNFCLALEGSFSFVMLFPNWLNFQVQPGELEFEHLFQYFLSNQDSIWTLWKALCWWGSQSC